jgi:hypothetical protein
VASAPEQLALLVLAHLLPALLDHAAQKPFLDDPRDGGGDWLVARGGEVNGCARTARDRCDARARAERERENAVFICESSALLDPDPVLRPQFESASP